jgi:hypothetical protein
MAEINKMVVPISDGQGGYTPTEITFEGSGGGGSLPDEVITYEEFMAKTDAEKESYTGYVSGWPMRGSEGDIAMTWTRTVSAYVADTVVTIEDSNITENSNIMIFAENAQGLPITWNSVVVTTGQAVITLSQPLTIDATFKLLLL